MYVKVVVIKQNIFNRYLMNKKVTNFYNISVFIPIPRADAGCLGALFVLSLLLPRKTQI